MSDEKRSDWKSRATFGVALVLFFGSGAVSLVYQTLWVSWWVHIFGGSGYAVATVLAAFMAGLGLGSWLLGRFADRSFDRLAGYGLLEIGIGLYALLIGGVDWNGRLFGRDLLDNGLHIPRMTEWVQGGYATLYNQYPDAVGLLVAVRFAMSFVLLLPVTTMMGATLPMLSRHLVSHRTGVGDRVGSLYSWNTFGAVVGTLAAGFVLIEQFGRSQTNQYMVAANLCIGALALLWTCFVTPSDDTEAPAEAGPRPTPGLDGESTRNGEGNAGSDLTRFWAMVMLLVFACSGAVAMVYEVAWSRLTGLILGSSTYSFTIMLATFLVGIAQGSAWAGRWLGGVRASLLTFAVVQLGVGLGTCGVVLGGEFLPVISLWLLPLREMNNPNYPVLTYLLGQLSTAAVCVAMMIVPALFLGACFPVVVQVYNRNLTKLGRSIGVVYGSNTAGAILGSILGGFLLLPQLGLYGTLAVGAVVNLALSAVLGVGALACSPRDRDGETTSSGPAAVPALRGKTAGRWHRPLSVAVIVVSVALTVVVARAPAWDPVLMNFGVFQYGDQEDRDTVTAHGVHPAGLQQGLNDLRDSLAARYLLLYARDGLNSSVTVMCTPTGARDQLFRDLSSWPEERLTELREKLVVAAEHRYAELADSAKTPAEAEGIARTGRLEIQSIRAAPPEQLRRWVRMLVRRVSRQPAGAVDKPDFEQDVLTVELELRDSFVNRPLMSATVMGTVAQFCRDRHLRNNGKVDASDIGDMTTQLIIAYMPLLAHPAPDEVCVIGLGSGTTVGAVAQFRDVREIHCVELEPAVVEAARANFCHRHRDFAADPRVRLFEQDGRNHLALYDKQYDLIINEPSNPWIAGIANLFTREFYQAAKARLKPGGILCQWLQLYGTDWADYLMVLRTLRSEFAYVYIFKVDPADTGDTMILASQEPIPFEPARMQQLIDRPDHTLLRADLKRWLITDAMTLLHSTWLLGTDDVDRVLANWLEQDTARYGRVNTDDRPLLEYSAPRTLVTGRQTEAILARLWKGRTRHLNLGGPLRTWQTDWPPMTRAAFEAGLRSADRNRLTAELFRIARRYLETRDWAEAEDALWDCNTLAGPEGSGAGWYGLGLMIRQRRSEPFEPWLASEYFARAAAAGLDPWLAFPPDEHVLSMQEQRAVAESLCLHLPREVWPYRHYARVLARSARQADASERQQFLERADACRRRAEQLLWARLESVDTPLDAAADAMAELLELDAESRSPGNGAH